MEKSFGDNYSNNEYFISSKKEKDKNKQLNNLSSRLSIFENKLDENNESFLDNFNNFVTKHLLWEKDNIGISRNNRSSNSWNENFNKNTNAYTNSNSNSNDKSIIINKSNNNNNNNNNINIKNKNNNTLNQDKKVNNNYEKKTRPVWGQNNFSPRVFDSRKNRINNLNSGISPIYNNNSSKYNSNGNNGVGKNDRSNNNNNNNNNINNRTNNNHNDNRNKQQNNNDNINNNSNYNINDDQNRDFHSRNIRITPRLSPQQINQMNIENQNNDKYDDGNVHMSGVGTETPFSNFTSYDETDRSRR